MRNSLIATIAFLATAMAGQASAASDWFQGQTGQYHLIPDGQDVQDLTLVGEINAPCDQGMALFAIDETGKEDNVPFVVPARTVFVLTDAVFTGVANGSAGRTPVLNIAQASQTTTYDRASFLASRPLAGIGGESFAGSGSLATGAVFSVNSKLCAHLSYDPFVLSWNDPNLTLGRVVIHGKVVDDSRTTSWPYFSW